MKSLLGTQQFEDYWRKRIMELYEELENPDLSEKEIELLEQDIVMIYKERCRNMDILKKKGCATCDDGVCTSGCVS